MLFSVRRRRRRRREEEAEEAEEEEEEGEFCTRLVARRFSAQSADSTRKRLIFTKFSKTRIFEK